MRVLLLLLLFAPPASAYSLLTHEAIIDASWESVIIPALRQRFPSTPAHTLRACRAYAYGGAIAPDMGYFPRESRLFSDLLHYVRTGDFVAALTDSARTPQEYAFALGALAHYTADRYGHPIAVNRAVPLDFPKLGEKYGPVVTYDDDKIAHVRAEFGFDVLQTARGNYAAADYTHFIDFQIADDLLKRAFRATYGLEVDSLFGDFERSVRTFRWAVREVFPQLTRQAWNSKREEILSRQPRTTARAFRYKMWRRAFIATYGRGIDRPGFRARVVAGALRVLPKVGPLKALKPVIPSAEAEALFIRSFDTVAARYRQTAAVHLTQVHLLNVNYDTGEPTERGDYPPADEAYASCLLQLQEQHWDRMNSALKAHLLDYFASPDTSCVLSSERSKKVADALADLRAVDAL